MQVTTIGLDIAKNVFQVHAIDAAEKVVVRRQLRRSQVLEFFKALPACLVGTEACATAHYWARELTKRALFYVSGLDRSWRFARAFSRWRSGLQPGDYDQLHHFIAGWVWDAQSLWRQNCWFTRCTEGGAGQAAVAISF